MKISFIILLLLISSAYTATSGLDSKELNGFIEKFCYDCHGDGNDKGGLDFDKLSKDLSDHATQAEWVDIFDRVISGDMPPKKKKKRPTDEDLKLFYKILAPALTKSHSVQKGTVMRRLNRQEYENTMNDIFGTNMRIANMLPEDGRSHEFDNVGSALGFSMEQLQKYLTVADQVIDKSIVSTIAKPKVNILKASYLNDRSADKFIGDAWKKLPDGAIVRFAPEGYPSGMIRGSGVQVAGFYRVKVHGYAHQSQQPINFHVGGTSFNAGLEKPIYGFFSFPPDKLTTREFVTYIEKNYMISVEPYGINDPDRYHRKKKGLNIDDYKGPGLAIKSVEVEGPLLEEYPSRGHQLIFSDLDRQEIMPGNPKNRLKKWYKPRYKVNSNDELSDASKVLTKVARKAFRRPQVEIAPYLNLFKSQRQKGDNFETALRTSISAIFCSPDFLYLKEENGKLDNYEIATRLSYFLSRSLPDEELLNSAKDGKLTSAEEREKHLKRLLLSPRFERFITDFTNAWLNLREMDFTAPDKDLFPEFDTYLRYSMPLESKAFLRELIHSNLSVSNLVKSDFAMINERLASLYQINGVKGAQIRKVKLPENSPRGGFLTQAAILKVSANGTNTSPIVRGIWVLERILGITPPPPPEGVPGVEPDIRGAETLRETLEKHRNMSSCRTCHKKIDPIGFALESFNPIGGERTYYRSLAKKAPKVKLMVNGRNVRYKQGPNVDATGEFLDGQKFQSYIECRDILASQKELLAKAFTKKLLTFATGREMGFSDRDEIKRIVKIASKNDYRVKDILSLVINSKIFLSK
ncbi:MAG: DUF1592 domain-containing protein [Lentisphaerales bacterium]|nr:DUF1592 domain-containing protein [Lentisphaerales bacterium]